MRTEERAKLDVIEMNCLRRMCGVTRTDEMRRKGGTREKLSDRVEGKVLTCGG